MYQDSVEGPRVAQATASTSVQNWYQNVYRPAWGDINDATTDKNPKLATELRNGLDKDSAEYYRQRR
jgi:hypothetical protein